MSQTTPSMAAHAGAVKIHTGAAASAEEAIVTRKSVRAFLPRPVPREDLERLLAVASRAPSGVNTQPWRVYVLGGEKKARLSEAIVEAHYHDQESHQTELKRSPDRLPEPFKSRQREIGWAMYGLLGIQKGDREGTLKQHARNYHFFDAPVGLIYTVDNRLELGSWLDYGMFLQNVMVAARGMGLHTCPQVAFARYHRIIKEHLGIPGDEIVVCGMSLGYADPEAPINQLETTREPVSAFATFLDF